MLLLSAKYINDLWKRCCYYNVTSVPSCSWLNFFTCIIFSRKI